MRTKTIRAATALCTAAATLVASAVEPVNVPELMVTKAGAPVKDVATWEKVRRAELKEIFCENEYGWRPVERPDTLAFELAEPDKLMMDGKAIRKRVLDWVETVPLSPRHPQPHSSRLEPLHGLRRPSRLEKVMCPKAKSCKRAGRPLSQYGVERVRT